ncbi:DeoR/GlpR family DNA-binding transcription regulator [Paenibacillus doosanensis]|uniref:DeoR/GlpR family DNA-binding transcription regulator n=1 Tax=Paenibacillus doosanensis TaxID=1229154 RepID=UPI00217F2F7D|nr:DeoR/GlpR family DNA-binding transcription regulator [Paenibacillus doosanensis]MCS7460964.1 DeoR/GlpR family DNA-binding transcription regulator [Paenibacillus doosanensis]
MSLNGEERKQTILNLLQIQGKVRTPELVEQLEVSAETVRRYLEELEFENKLKRVYGGAIRIHFEREEPSHFKREVLHAEEKRRIGRAAADFVQDKDVIVLDDGTTALHMIEFLLGKQGITVLVSSVPALNLLIDYKNKGMFSGEIVFIGGRVNAAHYRVRGAAAQHFMSSFHVDKAFVVADGIRLDKGITSYDDERGLLSRMFLKQADQAIVLGDHSKIGSAHFFKMADLSEVDMIISDAAPPAEWREKLAEQGIHWVAAGEVDGLSS